VDGTRILTETHDPSGETQESSALPSLANVLDPPPNPAESGAPETLQTITDDEPSDLPSESCDRPVGTGAEHLLALARAVDALLVAGLVAQARPLVRQLVAALEGTVLALPAATPTLTG
jgi:hypothetical protein